MLLVVSANSCILSLYPYLEIALENSFVFEKPSMGYALLEAWEHECGELDVEWVGRYEVDLRAILLH